MSLLASHNRIHHRTHQQIAHNKIRFLSSQTNQGQKNNRWRCWEVKEVLEVAKRLEVL